jgi:hypothetical protein
MSNYREHLAEWASDDLTMGEYSSIEELRADIRAIVAECTSLRAALKDQINRWYDLPSVEALPKPDVNLMEDVCADIGMKAITAIEEALGEKHDFPFTAQEVPVEDLGKVLNELKEGGCGGDITKATADERHPRPLPAADDLPRATDPGERGSDGGSSHPSSFSRPDDGAGPPTPSDGGRP